MVYFETERLIFRDWNTQDLYEFRIMNKDTLNMFLAISYNKNKSLLYITSYYCTIDIYF